VDAEAKSALLKSLAIECGFDRAGVCELGRAEHADRFIDWLRREEHAGMAYLERRLDVRLDPSGILPGARSALCVALQYHPPASGVDPDGDLWPRVARYARGDDYHDLMLARLRELAALVEEAFPGTGSRPYVDTGPVLERDLAARAGLGIAGKNTNLLHPEAGSWFFLGELFLTLELAPDPAVADLCGSCTRCLEACPTGALPEPYRLDSNRCISYWTIEHRGALPEAAREMVGEWVFGCDVCQEVCPLNQAEAVPGEPAFEAQAHRTDLDLAGLLGLDRDGYVEAFRGSAMKRAKLEGLQRNAAVAMGNRRDPRYVESLGRALREGEAVVRGHAAWALGRIGGVAATAELGRAAESERDPEVVAEIAAALAAGRPSG
jgi:epoxyqueuosine reductase